MTDLDDAGIDDALIEKVVRAFYVAARADPLLGPVFAARIADWEAHLTKMFAFWSSVTRRTGRYHGHPMQKHAALPVDSEHFDRWLALFSEAVTKIAPPAAAARFESAAARIAQSLEWGVAVHNRVMLPARGRFRLEPETAR